MAILSSNSRTYRHASVLDLLFCNALSLGMKLTFMLTMKVMASQKPKFTTMSY